MTGRSIDRNARSSDRGFALVLVIWVTALLAVLAASVAADSRSEAVIARNRLDLAQARALADAGITFAILGLVDANPETRWRADARPASLRYGDANLTIVIQDEGGKIDLNEAPLELIAGLLDEFGVDGEERTAITSGISDRRRAFAAASAGGNNAALPRRDLYTAGGNAQARFFQPDAGNTDLAASPFADVSELRLIPGVSRKTFERLRPWLTTYSENATINPLTATREALLAVPGISPQDVDFFFASREQPIDNGISKPALSGVDRYVRVADLHAATITARALRDGGASFTREAAVLISPTLPLAPYRILHWGQPVEPPPADEIVVR